MIIMSTQDVLVSQKFNNYNYAPGIATYGIDGKTGKSGIDGNNIYFTDFDLKNQADLKLFATQIIYNYLPIKNSTVKISRTYKNGDFFFDQLGIIYSLTDKDGLLSDIESIYSWEDYFTISGRISVADNSSLFVMSENNRLILNSSLYSGYDIAVGVTPEKAEELINTEAAVNIVSNKVNGNDNIEMINIQSVDDVDIEDGKLSVYYKTTENAFYLDSNKPIIINGDVKINNNTPDIDYDNFSTVLTSDDTITYFKHICDKLRYNVLYDSSVNRYKLVIYQEDGGSDDLEYLVNRNETIYGKVYTGDNEQILLKLSNIINSPINSSNYYDYMGYEGLTFNTDPIKNSFSFGFQDSQSGTNTLFTKTIDSTNILVVQSENSAINALNIDISINDSNQSLNKIMNNQLFGCNIFYYVQNIKNLRLLVYNIDIKEWTISDNIPPTFLGIKKQSYSKQNNKNVFKFTFNTNEILLLNNNNLLYINIYPLTLTDNNYNDYGQKYESNYMASPIQIALKLDKTLNGVYTLYFTLDYSEEKFSIKNIMLFDRDNLDKQHSIEEKPCIISYLSDSVKSVQRFALLHNTEIFINYQEQL